MNGFIIVGIILALLGLAISFYSRKKKRNVWLGYRKKYEELLNRLDEVEKLLYSTYCVMCEDPIALEDFILQPGMQGDFSEAASRRKVDCFALNVLKKYFDSTMDDLTRNHESSSQNLPLRQLKTLHWEIERTGETIYWMEQQLRYLQPTVKKLIQKEEGSS